MKNLIFIITVVLCLQAKSQNKIGFQLEINNPLLAGKVESNPLAEVESSLGKGLGIEFISTINGRLELQYGIFNAMETYEIFNLHKSLNYLTYTHNYFKLPLGLGIYDKRAYNDYYWKFTVSTALQVGVITMGENFSPDLASVHILPSKAKSSYYTFLYSSELSFNHEVGFAGQLKYSLSMTISPFKMNEISDAGLQFRLTSRAWPALSITYYPQKLYIKKKRKVCQ